MFAPWCPTCASRMLLGPRRVEAVEAGPDGPRVVLRCFCDTVLVWSATSDGRAAAPTGSASEQPVGPAPRTSAALAG